MFIHLSTVVILLYLGSPTYGEPGSTRHILARMSGHIPCDANGGPYFNYPVNNFSLLYHEQRNAITDYLDDCRSYRFLDSTKVGSYSVKVVAGFDTNTETLYICRAYHKGGILVGKAKFRSDYEGANHPYPVCYIGMDNREIQIFENFEVLTNPRRANLTWVRRPQNFCIPINAIVGGRTVDRHPIYIGRCSFEHGNRFSRTPGSLYIGAKELKVPYSGREVTCTDYEILVCS